MQYNQNTSPSPYFFSPPACRLAPRARVRFDRPQSTQSGHRNRRSRRRQPCHWIGLVIIITITLARAWSARRHTIGASGDRATDLGGRFAVLRVVRVVIGRGGLGDKAFPHARGILAVSLALIGFCVMVMVKI